jgi:hypothetical protein
MMMELHSRGKTIQDIAECLKKVPLNPRMISAIKSAYASGYYTSTVLFLFLLLLLVQLKRIKVVLPQPLNSHPTPSSLVLF